MGLKNGNVGLVYQTEAVNVNSEDTRSYNIARFNVKSH